jgi:nucleoside phosphorylase/SAM-dependent methyltransferase
MQAPVDFVIITPLAEEREALLRKLGNPRRLATTGDDNRIYYGAELAAESKEGDRRRYKIIVTALAGMGRVPAAIAAADAIRRWRPARVLLVGIAGGLKASGIGLGDVLISDQVADYEIQKLLPNQAPQVRWRVYPTDTRLLNGALNLKADEWHPLVDVNRPLPGSPAARFGPVCTGDKSIANDLAEEYRETWSKLVGVEMEAGGVAGASFEAAESPRFFMIRGVSDLADANESSADTKAWRPYACEVAAAYTVALLKSGPTLPLSNGTIRDRPTEPNSIAVPTRSSSIKQGRFRYEDPQDEITYATIRHLENIAGLPNGYWRESEDAMYLDFAQQYFRRARGNADSAAIDVGAGCGRNIKRLAEYCRHVTALEADPVRFNAAKSNVRSEDGSLFVRIEFVNERLEKFNPSRKYDLVICSHVLQHVRCDKVPILLQKIRALCSDRGSVLIMTTLSPDDQDSFKKGWLDDSCRVHEDPVSADEFDRLVENRLGFLPIRFFSFGNLKRLMLDAGLRLEGHWLYHCVGTNPGELASKYSRDQIANSLPGAAKHAMARDIALAAVQNLKFANTRVSQPLNRATIRMNGFGADH